MFPFVDISYANGNYDMQANPDSIIAIRMSSGDNGLHFDSQAATNYKNATDYGKVIINYHYAGTADPTTEANFFLEAVSPYAEGDIYALDIEQGQSAGWINDFVSVVQAATGCWPLIYMDISTANSTFLDVDNNCGLWLAAPSWGFDQDITELNSDIIYVAQQGPIVNGVDSDMFFAPDLNHVKAYGYKVPVSTPPSEPPVAVPTEPTPSTPVSSTPVDPTPPVVTPSPSPTPPNIPSPAPSSPKVGLWQSLLNFLKRLLS